MRFGIPETRRRRLERLLAPVEGDLRRFALRLTKDGSLADDVLQEALVTAVRKLDQLREDAAFRSWMNQVVHRTWLRRRPQRPESWMLLWTDLDRRQRAASVPGPEDRFVARRVGEAIAQAFERLPEGQRAAIELVDGQGYGFGEAAEILGIPAGTVASRVGRARATLRADLADLARSEGVTP